MSAPSDEDAETTKPVHPVKQVVQLPGKAVNEIKALVQDVGTDIKTAVGDKKHHAHKKQDEAVGEQEGYNPFDEVSNALLGAIGAYALSDLRKFGQLNEGKLRGDQEVLEQAKKLPIGAKDVIMLMHENLEEASKVLPMDLYMSAVELLGNEFLEQKEEDPKTIVVIDDVNPTELVYDLVVDHKRKQIELGFRGSVTVRDFVIDANLLMTWERNPLRKTHQGGSSSGNTIPQARYVGIHNGFYTYLLEKKAKTSKSKYEIIHEHLDRLFKEYPSCSKLLVTGHSLGAALATLFAFQSACDNRIAKPITCIAFASPRVGNDKFSRAFQELILRNKIRFLRVSNHKDAVTLVPERPALPCFMGDDGIYQHVGAELKLYRDKKAELITPTIHKSRSRLLLRDLGLWCQVHLPPLWCFAVVGEDVLRWHSCAEYLKRLQVRETELEELDMQDLIKNVAAAMGREELEHDEEGEEEQEAKDK